MAIPRFDPVEVKLFHCCLNYLYWGSTVGPAWTSGHLCVWSQGQHASFITSRCHLSALDSVTPLSTGRCVAEGMSVNLMWSHHLWRAPLLHSSHSREKEKSPSFQISISGYPAPGEMKEKLHLNVQWIVTGDVAKRMAWVEKQQQALSQWEHKDCSPQQSGQ